MARVGLLMRSVATREYTGRLLSILYLVCRLPQCLPVWMLLSVAEGEMGSREKGLGVRLVGVNRHQSEMICSFPPLPSQPPNQQERNFDTQTMRLAFLLPKSLVRNILP